MPSKKETLVKRTKVAMKTSVKSATTGLKKPKNEPVRTIKIVKAVSGSKKTRRETVVAKRSVVKAPEAKVTLNNLNVLLMEKRKASKISKATMKPEELVVTLPSSISLRAKNKAGSLLSVITHDFEHSAMRISYTAGFCFVLLGTVLASSGLGALTLMTFDGYIVEESLQSQMAAPLSSGPRLTIFEQIPKVISEPSQHTFSFTNAIEIEAVLLSIDEGTLIPLEVFTSSDDIYQIHIDPSTLTPSTYELKISGRAKDTQILYTKTAAEFTASAVTAVIDNATTTPGQEGVTEAGATIEGDDSVEVAKDSEKEIVDNIYETDKPVSITIPGTALEGSTRLSLEAPSGVSNVEMWLRPIRTSQLFYLGTAKRDDAGFAFYFDTTTIPDGEYVLIGKTRHENDYVEVETSKFSVTNAISLSSAIKPQVLGEATTTQNERTFAGIVAIYQGNSTSSSIDGGVLSVIATHQTELRDVFVRYAVAVQAKDSVLIDLAKAQIESVRAEIMSEVLKSDIYNKRANAIELSLIKYFDEIMKRTDSFEEVRQIASPDSWTDSDNDGISDIDESFVFGSNPTVIDTDNDGVLDGVEIIQGFDPLVADADTPIVYESPLHSLAPADTQLLGITAVLPVIEYTDSGEERSTEIKGWSYPNSFVTIYLFSEPIVMKVKTDENGYFSLVLDKELDDGEHEVYAAITDNKGDIIVQSSVYRFVKDGEKLLNLASEKPLPYMQATIVTPNAVNHSNAIAGIGILALGLILLMLSLSLRRREKKL